MSDADILLTLHQKLAELGLNEKEIKIYLAMLTVGTAPASTLGERTDIQRSTAQYTCQQLHKMGIVSMIQKGNTYLYTPEPPEKLLLLIRKQQDELVAQEEGLHRMIGTLKSLMSPHAVVPTMRFYEGRDGIVEAYTKVQEDVVEGSEMMTYLEPLEPENVERLKLRETFETFIKTLQRKNVHTRIISPDSKTARYYAGFDAPGKQETRFVNIQENLLPTEIMIYGDTMYSMTAEGDQMFCSIVRSKAITSMHKAIFELAWKQATSAQAAPR